MEDTKLELSCSDKIRLIILSFLIPFTFIIFSWDIKWLEGWIMTIFFIVQNTVFMLYLYYKAPQLLKERMNKNGGLNQQKGDKIFLLVFSILGLAWYIILAIGHSLGWNNSFPPAICALGLVLLPISTFTILNTFAENNFASHMVRIQTERGQKVISSGVYSVVRHPMYIGAILTYIGVSLFINSLIGLIVGLILSALFVLRIFGEEKMLETELEGYKEYEKKVKYRLIPYIW